MSKTDAELYADQQDAPDWDGPTRADAEAIVRTQARAEAAVRRAVEVADYRRRHPETTAPDGVVALLADLEKAWTKGPAA